MLEPTIGPSLLQDSVAHSGNVIVHVIAGTLALILGFIQLVRRKGGPGHSSRGRVFLWCVAVVVVTAALGLMAFRFVAFLAVITLLVAYWGYSGYRALQIRAVGPGLRDSTASCAGLVAAALFVMFLHRVRLPWAPVVIYSTLGTLVLVCSYDLARFAFPRRWYRRLWLYEHIVKMLGAHGALAAAFSGTVLAPWQPVSQVAPSMIWTMAMLGFVLYYRRR